jgi:hypothetical protein
MYSDGIPICKTRSYNVTYDKSIMKAFITLVNTQRVTVHFKFYLHEDCASELAASSKRFRFFSLSSDLIRNAML